MGAVLGSGTQRWTMWGGAISPAAEFDGLAAEAGGREAAKGAVLVGEVMEAAFGFFGEFFEAAVV